MPGRFCFQPHRDPAMNVPGHPDLHLSYCLNIHRGERWADQLAAIDRHTRAVRDRVAAGGRFGLGLRLGVDAAKELDDSADLRESFRQYCGEQDLYPFTVNAFPYGRFHDTRVKEQVYAPDWRTGARVDYTMRVADVLADLLPPGQTGSISTVPGSFKVWIDSEADELVMARHLLQVAEHLRRIEDERGVYIHLGLEPEPACFLETTEEMVAFHNERLLRGGAGEAVVRRYLGVNFDCCHFALQFEDLEASLDRYEAEGILLSKVHLSAALHLDPGCDTELLRPFDEPVYLHQVKALTAAGEIRAWTDLPEALRELPALADNLRGVRCHFHVPLDWVGNPGGLGTTRDCLSEGFFRRLPDLTEHLEIETYTFDVLPPELRRDDVVDSIVPEFDWVLSRFAGT